MAEAEVTAFSMNGGSGLKSYSRNSNFQRNMLDEAKDFMRKSIAQTLDIHNIISSTNTLRVADLGCATGPNTFLVVQNIIDAVALKLESAGQSASSLPEFQVFFSDKASNDFNQLFSTLPSERKFFASGVPGSFHGRLFPRSSLHLVHSSFALHFLSRVPEGVADKSSPAWNKGKISYSNSTPEVVKAYEDQYAKDLESFLRAREEEIVHGGLIIFLIPFRDSETPHSQAPVNKTFEFLGSCLIEMINKGRIAREKVDSFNFPIYFGSAREIETAVNRNGSFSIEITERLPGQKKPQQPEEISLALRAGLEGFMKNHFEDDVLDELFELLLPRKFEEYYSTTDTVQASNLYILLKRI